MKAVTRIQYGNPSVLQIKEIPKPKPGEKELLIKVYATTINRTDCGSLTGKPYLVRFFTGLIKPRRLVTGTDFAGEVVAVGVSVKEFKIGDRVWGLNDEGLQSQAQYMCLSIDQAVVKIPENISFEEAVVCAEGAHYAFNFLNKVELKAGQEVLVNGATGAIGSALLQLLKYRGLVVTAVGNTKNITLLKDLGADKIVDYEKEDFTKDTTDTYQYIFDAVGKSTFGKCKPLLNDGGAYLSSELGPNAENLYLPFLTYFSKKRNIFPIPSNRKRSIVYLNQLLKEGKFKAVIDKRYGFKDIQDAYTYVASGQKTGNVIFNPWLEKVDN